MGDHLLVFVKEPRPGAVKSRLAAGLGDDLAAAVYRAVAEHAIRRTMPATDEYERLLFFSPAGSGDAVGEWLRSAGVLAAGDALIAQAEGDLGVRMTAAFEEAFRRGARRAALVGSDVPSLDREDALTALESLDDHDVVLGPATDGGYYLVALAGPEPDLFRDVPWSTAVVLGVTLERAARRGRSVRLLRTLGDADTPADLAADWARIRVLLPEPLRGQVAARLGRKG